MRIQHNIAALNSYRNLTNNNSAVSKNLEKLSSGYRINRAGDDAAGLAISEKMRAQITGLETAQKNANDGISLVQTAEGALTEVHSMLNRMVELAQQSANGTYQDEVDRENLQKEMTALKDEVDRISEATNFNGINLLDGSLSKVEPNLSKATIAANSGTDTIASVDATKAQTVSSAISAGAAAGDSTFTVEYLDASGKSQSVTVNYTGSTTLTTEEANILSALQNDSKLSSTFDISLSAADHKLTFKAKEGGDTGIKVLDTKRGTTSLGATTYTAGAAGYQTLAATGIVAAGTGSVIEANDTITLNGKTYEFVANADTEPTTEGAIAVIVGATDADTVANLNKVLEGEGLKASAGAGVLEFRAIEDGAGLTLQIGDTSDDFNQLTVSVSSMDTKSLGIAGVDVSTQAGAKTAVQTIKDAINKVSSTRGDLGAIQNRLEHTINNLSVTTENMTSAESRIRDVDMAEEMMAYTKNNILVQASQAMLAQANQVPQGVLQLLQ